MVIHSRMKNRVTLHYKYYLSHTECKTIKKATTIKAMEATLQQQVKLCKKVVKNVNMYQNNG
jgi:hypothetical protein